MTTNLPQIVTEGKAGAPRGNQNAKNATRWKRAILTALSREEGEVEKGLNKIADRVVRMAIAGDKWAIDHIADRIDGKVAQAVVVSGDENGAPLQTHHTIEYIGVVASQIVSKTEKPLGALAAPEKT